MNLKRATVVKVSPSGFKRRRLRWSIIHQIPVEREKTIFLYPLETIRKNCIFDLCGIKIFSRRMFNIIVTCTLEQRQQWLDEVKSTIDHHFSLIKE
jgi:hypothetical protein